MRTDANGKDPDSHSATLRRYHQLLWSKPLPSGAPFELDAKLQYATDRGRFWLASDAIAHTYTAWTTPPRLVEAISQIPANEIATFYDLACTIGAFIVFPGPVRLDGRWKQSINQARGMHPRIKDRFDLTLECIRRHYAGRSSPLARALAVYADFFDLFGDFTGYVDHFVLNDLVSSDYAAVRFYTNFDDFSGDPLPAGSAREYREYMTRSMPFMRARNTLIERYAADHLGGTRA